MFRYSANDELLEAEGRAFESLAHQWIFNLF